MFGSILNSFFLSPDRKRILNVQDQPNFPGTIQLILEDTFPTPQKLEQTLQIKYWEAKEDGTSAYFIPELNEFWFLEKNNLSPNGLILIHTELNLTDIEPLDLLVKLGPYLFQNIQVPEMSKNDLFSSYLLREHQDGILEWEYENGSKLELEVQHIFQENTHPILKQFIYRWTCSSSAVKVIITEKLNIRNNIRHNLLEVNCTLPLVCRGPLKEIYG